MLPDKKPVPEVRVEGGNIKEPRAGVRLLGFQQIEKRKYDDFAELEDNRVAIKRLLNFEDLEGLEERSRRNAKRRRSRRRKFNKDEYLPMVPKKEGESQKEWIGKERFDLKRDREKYREQSLAKGDIPRKLKIPQIARGPGQPISISEIPAPNYVAELNHKRRRRRATRRSLKGDGRPHSTLF